MKINKYPDGTSYVELDWEIGRESTQTTFRINSYEDLWHLNQFCEVLRYNNIEATITIPCLIDAQADRRFGEYQSNSLILIANMLNEYDNIHFKIFHPHNPEVVEALFDRVEIIDNSKFILKVLHLIKESDTNKYPARLNDEFDRTSSGLYYDKRISENLILMSSDAGGFKPLVKLCDKLQWVGQIHSCSKGRSWDGEKSELTQRIGKDDFYGKDILIVDDICVKGGTFKGLANLLRQRNCGKLYLATSHMTLKNLGDDPVTKYFDMVFTTNSKYDEYQYYGAPVSSVKPTLKPENLHVLDMFG